MAAYRLMSTRHRMDGSVEPPSATFDIVAETDREADARARALPLDHYIDGADHAWLVDEAGSVVCSFPVAAGRSAC